MKTCTGQLIIHVIVKCRECGNDIEISYRKRLPDQDEVLNCPVCWRIKPGTKFKVRLNHPLVPKPSGGKP